MSAISIKNGTTCSFWPDLWLGRIPKIAFPELFSFVKKSNLTLSDAKALVAQDTLFHLPLSEIAFNQLQMLLTELDSVQLSDSEYCWSYSWGNGIFSTKKVYKRLEGHRPTNLIFRWLWKSSCQNKHKLFFWLLIHDRLNTKELLRRKHMPLQDTSCSMWSLNTEDDARHLFISPIHSCMLGKVKYHTSKSD